MSDALTEGHEGLLNGLDEILDPAHTALVVVDMQNDFCAENGYIHNAQGVDMSANKPLAARIGKMVEAARETLARTAGARTHTARRRQLQAEILKSALSWLYIVNALGH